MLSESRAVGQDSAYLYSLAALSIARHIGYEFGIGKSYQSLISFAKNESEVDSLVELSAKFFRESNNPEYEPRVFLKAATWYLTFSNKYVTAFHYANLFLSNNKNKDDPENLAKAWNIIGEVYRISKNHEKAMHAYRHSMEFSITNGKIIFLSPIINVGTIHLELGHLDSAMAQYDFVQNHLVKMDEKQSSTFAYIKYRKARVFLLHNNFNEALSEATTGLGLYNKLEHNEGRILTLGILSEIFFKQGSYDNAVLFGKQAVDLAVKINYVINDVDRICEIVAKSYYHLNDPKRAYSYQSIGNNISKRLFDPAATAALTNELLELETEKQQLQHELAEEQKSKHESDIREQRAINLFSIAGILILLGVSLLLYRNARGKHRLNIQLQEKQEEILAQTEELRASNDEIIAINSNLEGIVNERTRTIQDQNSRLRDYAYFNAHKVRGPLARILGLISIIEYEFPGEPLSHYREMLKTASNELDRSINEINDVLEVKNEEYQKNQNSKSQLAMTRKCH